MSWLKIDDAFEDHPKVEPLSHAAHRLWLRAACWCRKRDNSHTNGFVPKALLPQISKHIATGRKLLALVDELVGATAGGMFTVGLWEEADGGWQFHDWHLYQPTDAEPEGTLTREQAASIAGRASAAARRARTGTAQPVRSERPPNDSKTFDNRSGNDVRQTFDRTEPERLEPPGPTPLPGPEPLPLQQPFEGKIRCPIPLVLPDDTLKGLAFSPGIPRESALVMIQEFALKASSNANDRRSREAWVKCAIAALCNRWSDPSKRPKLHAEPTPEAKPQWV